MFVRSSFLYMDVFLLASGFFAGYKMSKDLEIRFRIPWMRRFLGRFIRYGFIINKLFFYPYTFADLRPHWWPQCCSPVGFSPTLEAVHNGVNWSNKIPNSASRTSLKIFSTFKIGSRSRTNVHRNFSSLPSIFNYSLPLPSLCGSSRVMLFWDSVRSDWSMLFRPQCDIRKPFRNECHLSFFTVWSWRSSIERWIFRLRHRCNGPLRILSAWDWALCCAMLAEILNCPRPFMWRVGWHVCGRWFGVFGHRIIWPIRTMCTSRPMQPSMLPGHRSFGRWPFRG